MLGKLWWFGMGIIFLVIFPALAAIVLVILFAVIMGGGAT